MQRMWSHFVRCALVLPVMIAGACAPCVAAMGEHITLRNGFELDCTAREVVGDRVRLYTGAGTADYLEVRADAIVRTEVLPSREALTAAMEPSAARGLPAAALSGAAAVPKSSATNAADLRALANQAGRSYNIDADLLHSIIRAESGGNARAVSRAGARGLMQLMPATATAMGVADSFAPEQNVAGGAAYLDRLLTLYHNDLVLAVAAYNAGPAAVARYHGVPPYRETRAYVVRVVREFNRRKLAAK